MITLEKKVVLVRANVDYPENSPNKWHIVVGEIEKDEESGVAKVVGGESYFVDEVYGGSEFQTLSCIMPNGLYKHNFMFKGPKMDIVKQGEKELLVAMVGNIVPTEEPTKVVPINPETELDAE